MSMNRHDSYTRPRVLIADDSRDTADIYGYLLEQKGYRVALAYDGLTALSLAKVTKPDLLIVNFMMPGLTGLEVVKELRDAGHATKAIITSGADEFEALKIRARQAGADGCVRQPWDTAELLAAVAAAVTSAPAR
jgi:DNA-binding response OmpR family regulator